MREPCFAWQETSNTYLEGTLLNFDSHVTLRTLVKLGRSLVKEIRRNLEELARSLVEKIVILKLAS